MKALVMSLPIKPSSNNSLGTYVGPVVGEYVSNLLNCDFVATVNTLHSFNDPSKYYDTYHSGLKQYISKNNFKIFNDSDYIKELLKNIENMVKAKKIVVREKQIFFCPCGMVDLPYENAQKINGKLFAITEEGYFCKKCNQKCCVKSNKCLALPYTHEIDYSVKIIPNFLEKDMKQIIDKYEGSDIVISKMRNTGIVLDYEQHTFNIDIEYVWAQFFYMFPEHTKKYLIASNHQLYTAYIVNRIAKECGHPELTFILTPYLKEFQEFQKKYKDLDVEKLKLAILFALKWKRKECRVDENIMKHLKKMNNNELTVTYKKISSSIEIINNSIELEKQMNAKTNLNYL